MSLHLFGLPHAALVTSAEPRTCRCGHVTSVFINAGGATGCLLCISPGVKIVHVAAAEVAGWIAEKKP